MYSSKLNQFPLPKSQPTNAAMAVSVPGQHSVHNEKKITMPESSSGKPYMSWASAIGSKPAIARPAQMTATAATKQSHFSIDSDETITGSSALLDSSEDITPELHSPARTAWTNVGKSATMRITAPATTPRSVFNSFPATAHFEKSNRATTNFGLTHAATAYGPAPLVMQEPELKAAQPMYNTATATGKQPSPTISNYGYQTNDENSLQLSRSTSSSDSRYGTAIARTASVSNGNEHYDYNTATPMSLANGKSSLSAEASRKNSMSGSNSAVQTRGPAIPFGDISSRLSNMTISGLSGSQASSAEATVIGATIAQRPIIGRSTSYQQSNRFKVEPEWETDNSQFDLGLHDELSLVEQNKFHRTRSDVWGQGRPQLQQPVEAKRRVNGTPANPYSASQSSASVFNRYLQADHVKEFRPAQSVSTIRDLASQTPTMSAYGNDASTYGGVETVHDLREPDFQVYNDMRSRQADQPHNLPVQRFGDRHIMRSPLLHEFHVTAQRANGHRWELRDIFGHVAEFAGDQAASRFVQAKLENAGPEDKLQVFEEVLPNFLQLTTDVFGNYVIQKIFDHGTQGQKHLLAQQMRGYVKELSMQMYGCRVVQKAIECVLVEPQVELIRELEDPSVITECINSQNGNHVIQKAISRIPMNRNVAIIEHCVSQVRLLATHAYGCRIVQRLLERCKGDVLSTILNELRKSARDLISHDYGNYVTQHIIQYGRECDRKQVIDIVAQDLIHYSVDKHASNVVEKCYETSTQEQREKMFLTLTCGEVEGPRSILPMMRSQYGNYVIQKIIKLTPMPDQAHLVQAVRYQLERVPRNQYCKHLCAIERFLNPFIANEDPYSSMHEYVSPMYNTVRARQSNFAPSLLQNDDLNGVPRTYGRQPLHAATLNPRLMGNQVGRPSSRALFNDRPTGYRRFGSENDFLPNEAINQPTFGNIGSPIWKTGSSSLVNRGDGGSFRAIHT